MTTLTATRPDSAPAATFPVQASPRPTTFNPNAPVWLNDLTFDDVKPEDVAQVIGLLGRGMRDNPALIAALGVDPEVRLRRIQRLFGGVLGAGMEIQLTAARRPDGSIVGVCGKAAPGACQPKGATKLKMLPVVFANGLRAGLRTMRWMGVWAKRDLPERHWHLGPVAVDAEYQGFGIGTALMTRFCADMDAAGEVAYLETDKPINVRFYERFGFETVGEQPVLGTTNWFMRRAPRPVS